MIQCSDDLMINSHGPVKGTPARNPAPLLPSPRLCTQTRHPERISTVDIHNMQALNSWRRVSDFSETVTRGAIGAFAQPISLRTRENSTGEPHE